ncbi:MAG: hypothetical protein CVU64_10075 [Deltaproteobacteria bacterium HGW-Deltaproteobacteria-21]|nr:MAG: hypothetical protein CVU64_10075 [Deltaproteobacteria bacterium HGW-Deltaproteobacteria-21]
MSAFPAGDNLITRADPFLHLKFRCKAQGQAGGPMRCLLVAAESALKLFRYNGISPSQENEEQGIVLERIDVDPQSE